jgi:hypothetical protein
MPELRTRGRETRQAMSEFSSKDIRDLEKWANGLSKFNFLDPLLVEEAQRIVRSLKEDLKGDLMSKEDDELNKMQNRLWDRSPAPKLTPEQLNAIDLLILGKTDREVSEIVGVRRETVTKWHKSPFFTAELNVKREALWTDAKLRLKALVYEAVTTLTSGLHSTDEKIAVTAAVHILKTVGLYDGEWKSDLNLPKTPEEAAFAQLVEDKTNYYKGSRPDSIIDWTTKHWTEDVGKELAAKLIDCEYENAVCEQKKELREYKKKTKAQLPQVEPVPLTIEEDLPRSDSPESIKA